MQCTVQLQVQVDRYNTIHFNRLDLCKLFRLEINVFVKQQNLLKRMKRFLKLKLKFVYSFAETMLPSTECFMFYMKFTVVFGIKCVRSLSHIFHDEYAFCFIAMG